MTSNDGRFTVVFNGEIYNYRELRHELDRNGSRFTTNSDTEVIIEAYRTFGDEMLLKLRGMFAFALYDRDTDDLVCARDRVGKKPFVYAATAGVFAFASEIPAVRQVQGLDTSFDHDALAAMLLHNLRHIPDPHTAYRGIKRLRAGHAMRVRRGQIERIWRYWTPQPANDEICPGRLREVLEEAVALRMRADVQVGALLSGGVDSTAIVAMMGQQAVQSVRTYAFGRNRDDEDIRRARVAAAQLRTNHQEVYFEPGEQWDILNRLISLYGEPIMLMPLVHAYTLCRAIQADGVKVVLNGNGADELFYGYSGHLRTLRVSQALEIMGPIAKALGPMLPAGLRWAAVAKGQRKAEFYRNLAPSVWADVLTKEAISTIQNRAFEELALWGSLTPSTQYIDESNFGGLMVENTHSVTVAGDLPAMATAVEMRSPFLDQAVVEYALAVPAHQKITGMRHRVTLKAILRDAVRDLIPPELLNAPKRGFGFGVQEGELLRGPWRALAEERLTNPRTADGLLCEKKVRRLWAGFLAGNVTPATVAKLLAIQLWLENEKSTA